MLLFLLLLVVVVVVERVVLVERVCNYQLFKGFTFGFFISIDVLLSGTYLLGDRVRCTCLGVGLQVTFCIRILMHPAL